jgi:hypothetical protein
MNPTDQAETSIPVETVSNGPNLNRTVTVRRKAAKRSERWYLAPPPQNIAASLSIPPARKKPRIEEPRPSSTPPDVSVSLPPPTADDDDPVTDTQSNHHPRAVRVTGRWIFMEDAKVTSAVTKMCNKKDGKEHRIDWVAVSALIPSRTNIQCRNRWRDVLAPSIDRSNRCTGKWTEDEDLRLKHSVQIHGGKDWAAIAALVPGRTPRQCLNRWHNALVSNIDPKAGRVRRWGEDEDVKLKKAVQTHGGKNWDAVASLVEARTKIQCRNRWHDVLNPSIDRSNECNGKWEKTKTSG